WLSLAALGRVTLLCAIGVGPFITLRRDFVQEVRKTAGQRLVFFERLSELRSGFKQVKLGRQRARELGDDVIAACIDLRVAGIRSSRLLADNSLLGEGILFALLAAMVFVLRGYVHTELATIASL